MKTNSNNINKIGTGILFVISAILLSCNQNVEKNQHDHHDTIKEMVETKADSAQIHFDDLKQKVSEKIKQKIEETDRQMEELKVKKEKAEVKIKNKIASEIEELQAKKEKLRILWDKLKETTKDNWRNYEKGMNEIFE